MSDLYYGPLAAELRPLLNKFYRAHRSPMRAGAEEHLWVAKETEIVAALSVRSVGHGGDDSLWLTGLFVAPALRGQGIASRLVNAACTEATGAVWLFCHPALGEFYARLGFSPCEPLPAPLAERFARYQRTKTLIALRRESR